MGISHARSGRIRVKVNKPVVINPLVRGKQTRESLGAQGNHGWIKGSVMADE